LLTKKQDKHVLRWLKFISLGFLLAFASYAKAEGLQSFKIDTMSIDVWKTKDKRYSYAPQYDSQWTHGGQFNLGLRVLNVLRWDNRFHLDNADSQVKLVGWEYRVTMDYFSKVQPFFNHHSEHLLDEGPNDRSFPVEDKYGVSFIFLNN